MSDNSTVNWVKSINPTVLFVTIGSVVIFVVGCVAALLLRGVSATSVAAILSSIATGVAPLVAIIITLSKAQGSASVISAVKDDTEKLLNGVMQEKVKTAAKEALVETGVAPVIPPTDPPTAA